MNTLLKLERESKLESKPSLYEEIYAERHGYTYEQVKHHPKLQLAAFLEWQVANHQLTVYEARKRFVAEDKYPESNRIAVGKTVITEYGYKYQDKDYAKGSVLELIQAYEDSIREL